MNPCIPRTWPRYEMIFRRPRIEYRIVVENPDGVTLGVVRVELDGVEQPNLAIPILEDGVIHQVRVIMGGKS